MITIVVQNNNNLNDLSLKIVDLCEWKYAYHIGNVFEGILDKDDKKLYY
jgi:hypothetical protein